MLVPLLGIVTGLIILVWSADRFVAGAAATAKNLGMSPLLIGLTIVSFGTSAPEILVSLMASLDQAGSLAIGNALGSNIANIGLVLGITALIAPLPVKSGILKKELPLLLAVTVLAGLLLYDLTLSLGDGLILIAALIGCLYLFYRFQQASPDDDPLLEESDALPPMSTGKALFWLFVGLALLIASSRLLVWGAVQIATLLGVSELIIGLTIVAIGTSLPELAASVASALKKHHDIALGNVVGSNIFNLAAVMALPGFISPVTLEPLAFSRDYVMMLLITLALIGFCLLRRPFRISRGEGALLSASYVAYLYLLYTASV